jgi:hypothetical protein
MKSGVDVDETFLFVGIGVRIYENSLTVWLCYVLVFSRLIKTSHSFDSSLSKV